MNNKKGLFNLWVSKFLLFDFFAVSIIWCFFLLWLLFLGGKETMQPWLILSRTSIYESLATIHGALLGFIITTVSIIIGYSTNEKLEVIVENKNYRDLWSTFTDTIRFLAIATLISIISLIVDNSNSVNWFLFSLSIYLTFLVVVRIYRCIQIFEKIIKILIHR